MFLPGAPPLGIPLGHAVSFPSVSLEVSLELRLHSEGGGVDVAAEGLAAAPVEAAVEAVGLTWLQLFAYYRVFGS